MAPPAPWPPNSGHKEDDDQEGQGGECHNLCTHTNSVGGMVGLLPPEAQNFCTEGEFLPSCK